MDLPTFIGADIATPGLSILPFYGSHRLPRLPAISSHFRIIILPSLLELLVLISQK